MKKDIYYFEKPGRNNTIFVLQLVKDYALANQIKKVVLASTRGDTARAAAEVLEGSGIQLVVIPWQFGFGEQNGLGEQPFPQSLVTELQSKGHRVHFGTMLFHTEELYGNNNASALANMLRIFGQGIKVCVEILLMAADGGCIQRGEKVLAVAGSSYGADTAVLASAAPSVKIGQLRIHEILCKPGL